MKIGASLLSADLTRLGEQAQLAIDAGVEYLHLDVMDGHFVPNISFGANVAKVVKPYTQEGGVILDVHLMIEKPDLFIPDFIRAGADNITVHVEACKHLNATIRMIKNAGIMAGVTLNPATPLISLEEILPDVDHILVMSVNPGFGGQDYIPGSTAKINAASRMIRKAGLDHIELEVDGGVKVENAREIADAGASILIAGSAIFNEHASISENILSLRRAAGQESDHQD